MAIDWIDSVEIDLGNGPVTTYPLKQARQRHEVRELEGGYLVISRDGIWIKFAVMEFCCSDGDGDNHQLSCVFHGEGPSGDLRECRHTWWGDEGYVFYPGGRLICDAFKLLAEFFDGM